MAGLHNVKTFASAQIFYSAGSTGMQILQPISIANTSDLHNRALFSSLPDIPFLITVWVGAPIASNLIKHTTWRWGYGIWSIVLPVAFCRWPLLYFLNMRKAARLHLLPQSPWQGQTFLRGARNIWYEIDVMGLLLLSAAISLILIPLTLAAKVKSGWNNASIIAMLVTGCLCLVVFPIWESSRKLAPHPFISLRLFTNRTVLAGCAIEPFYFCKLSMIPRTTHGPQALTTTLRLQRFSIPLSSHISTPTCKSYKTTPSSLLATLHKPLPLRPRWPLSSYQS